MLMASSKMIAAGIDLGKVRVGLAVSDELGVLAHPRPPLDGRDLGRLVERLVDLMQSEGIDVFVVGLPLHLSGAEGRAAARVRRFAERLRQRTQARVELYDERLTTRQARDRLRSAGLSERELRPRLDGAAAAILLQSWLDQHRGPSADA